LSHRLTANGSRPDADVELELQGDKDDPAKCAAGEEQHPGKVPAGGRSIGAIRSEKSARAATKNAVMPPTMPTE
jgi:hypothetical protein